MGHFSVIADGGVQFADSQFDLFASAPTREGAPRGHRAQGLFILGEIRTTVEYLGELQTDAFKENTIDTAWLDGIIAAKSIGVEVDLDMVINAAVYRGYKMITEQIDTFKDSLGKGQLSTLPLREMKKMPLEITYQDTKYNFEVTPKGPGVLYLGDNVKAWVKPQLAARSTSRTARNPQVYAKEKPLGLRAVLDGVTVLLQLYDPSGSLDLPASWCATCARTAPRSRRASRSPRRRR